MVQSWETACCHGFFEQDTISFSDITVLCCPLGVCILFLSKFSQCISFPKELLPVSLGDCFTWNGHSWEFIVEASTHHELGWGQSINCVRCGSILKEAVLQCRFPVYLLKWRFLLSSVEFHYSARLHHYSAASRGCL